MKSCENNCPVIHDLDTSADNAAFFAEQAESAIERTEQSEMQARFNYAETEEAILQGRGTPGFNPGELLEFEGYLLDETERMSRDAVENSADKAVRFRKQAEKHETARADALATCNPLACAVASLKRRSGSDEYACGAKNSQARAQQRLLSSGRMKPRDHYRELYRQLVEERGPTSDPDEA